MYTPALNIWPTFDTSVEITISTAPLATHRLAVELVAMAETAMSARQMDASS